MATANEPGDTPERATDAFPRWVWLASAGALLVIGWIFILFQNNFHVTPPVVFVCLGYGAGVAAVYTLFRTGAAAVTGGEDDDDASWGRPVGARAELEREKKALLKAIKEAEFDLQMGKLSKADAEAMIGAYRAQAIAVIREIDRKDGGEASAREQIEREVRARLEVAKAKKAGEAEKRPAGPAGKKGKKQAGAAGKKADAAKEVEEAAAKVEETAARADEVAAKAEETVAKAEEAAAQADEALAAEAAAQDGEPDDDARDDARDDQIEPPEPGNVEPRGAGAAKEATS